MASVHVTAITFLVVRSLLHQREEIYKKAFSPERKDWCKTVATKPETNTNIYLVGERSIYINETKIIIYIIVKAFSPERRYCCKKKGGHQTTNPSPQHNRIAEKTTLKLNKVLVVFDEIVIDKRRRLNISI